ncbi:hypothetical protein FD17_GL002053 [Lentilactobacillus sunkii DSM 19904]|uniref:Uncharacterized protein n=2 Tax=Lentilactobacillus sunkii TaxID=481719 RepID=A0A0R1KSI7_9LACO|nr:hypothetical protein FD17_GL002053 [Lentilactobacillus sunkii DSM 19904]
MREVIDVVKPMNFNEIKKQDKQQAKNRRNQILAQAKKKQTKLLKDSTDESLRLRKDTPISSNYKLDKKLKRDNKKLQKKLQSIQADQNSSQQNIMRLKMKVYNLKQENQTLRDTANGLESELKEAIQSRTEDYNTKLELKNNNEGLNHQIGLLNKRNQSLRTGMRHLIKSSQNKQVQRLYADKEKLKKKMEQTKVHLSKLDQRNAELTEKLHQYRNYEIPGQGKGVHRATTQELINELFARIDETRVGEFLSLLPLFNKIDYFLKMGMSNANTHLRKSELMKDNQELYGYIHIEGDQLSFIALDGSVFPDPSVIGDKFELQEGEVYRGNYNLGTDKFVINKHYVAANYYRDTASNQIHGKKMSGKISANGFINQFIADHPDAKDILAGKNIEIVSWFKQVSYKRAFQPFGVNIDILDPNEKSGGLIYQRIENVDTDFAFILLEGSHHVNSQIYKDRPAANPDKIRILENASPRELLQMSYDHFKSQTTRSLRN